MIGGDEDREVELEVDVGRVVLGYDKVLKGGLGTVGRV